MILLDIHARRMGNTTMRELGCWNVKVISVDSESRTAMCSWNSNQPKLYTEDKFKSLCLKPTKAYMAQEERRKTRGGRML